MGDLKQLPLHGLWADLGARFAPFAGWQMPVQFAGVMAEHLHTREKAGLFDVSHMRQIVVGDGAHALERLIPTDILGLAPGRQRYGMLTNAQGGVIDDLMVVNRGSDHLLVVNAGRFDADLAHLSAHLTDVTPIANRALFALQGPRAEAALSRLIEGLADLRFMDWAELNWGEALWISRSGYTGEDGFEISVPDGLAAEFVGTLLADPDVAPIGLGARDSLRLEAGLPLYGQDLGEDISPIEAGQAWSIGKARRNGGARAGGFPGAEVILAQLDHGAPRRRVGLLPDGRAPMRAGVEIFASPDVQTPIGHVTSGGFGPTLGAPMALALIDADTPKDVPLYGEVRGKRLPAQQAKLPFTPPGYKR
ncbi:glycine cleavage system aminomethyltransferase GcvT [Gymnodinialimonas sp. 2305UL16-5]|uniref:glycine cleavage system aminomethyltransferase GcvT n=1 Tax=Gymnodinialimonas mytili TaxID=3126503 RepID=UPI0030A34FA1